MKAWVCRRYVDPFEIALEDVPLREPGPTEVQIRIRAAGITFGQSLVLTGKYQIAPPLPFTPSNEMSGVVVAVGSAVTRWRPDDEVIAVMFTLGGGFLAEMATVDQRFVFGKPAILDFVEAAAFPNNYYTAYHALLRRGGLKDGETLVVHGASGGVGTASVQIGAALGATVIATGSDDERLQKVAELGATHVINHLREPLRDRIKALTEDRGADVFLDPVGGDLFDASLRAIAPGGRILVVGFTSGRFAAAPTNIVLVKMVSIIGVDGRVFMNMQNDVAMRDFHDLLEWADSGRIRPHIGAKYRLSEVPEAFAHLARREIVGKCVIVMD
jgi:NADPH2:quinone reductase